MEKVHKERKKLHYIPVSAIDVDTSTVRQFFDIEKLKEISASIKEKGVLQSIVVRPKKKAGNKFEVVLGMRRLKAALLAGRKEIPCVIEEVNDKTALELALTENIQREDLTPFEEGLGIIKLIKDYGYSIEQVRQRLGKSDDFIRSRIKLLTLSEEVQKHVMRGELGIEHAISLTRLEPTQQEMLAKEIMAESLRRDQIKELVLKERQSLKSEVVRPRGEISSHRIKLQVQILTRLLAHLDCDKLSSPERKNLKFVLGELKRLMNKIIQEIENAD